MFVAWNTPVANPGQMSSVRTYRPWLACDSVPESVPLLQSEYRANSQVYDGKGRLDYPVAHSHHITHSESLTAEMLRWKRTKEGLGIPVAMEVGNRE